ncbi:MAG: phospho-N-acetylmuramoyl-pentapeptide-transferase, partial [Kiloniellales bacterium]
MLYNLLVPLAEDISVLNVFRYITFRSGAAVMTALIISFLLGPPIISWLKAKQGEGQPIRVDGPAGHLLTKQGTPTMGGFLILLGITISTLLWADLTNGFVWAVLAVTCGFGLVGFADDYLKLTRRDSTGLPARIKLIAQVAIGTGATVWIGSLSPESLATHLAVPFLKDFLIDLGWFFVPFAV